MKKILFVINTLGRAGAEMALLELLQKLEGREYEVSLFVLLGQGEMIREIPSWVRVLTPVNEQSVLSKSGRRALAKTAAVSFFRNGRWGKKTGYLLKNLADMLRQRRFQLDKLLWRVVSDGAPRFDERFDLAVAWIEGGSAYYVSDWVQANKKAAFLHIDYKRAGYTRAMDQDCWACFEKIFAVSEIARKPFAAAYPEYAAKTELFTNLMGPERIRRRSMEPGGFSDGYDGLRILTVGRLVYQKGYDIAIDAMKRIKDTGIRARWYVLGEGDQRKTLENKIALLGLENDFVLLGASDNPYPYYAQTDLYVQASRFEGESIAVREAQLLGCAVLLSDCSGGDSLLGGGKYGASCELSPEGVAEGVLALLADENRRRELGQAAAQKEIPEGQENRLLALAE